MFLSFLGLSASLLCCLRMSAGVIHDFMDGGVKLFQCDNSNDNAIYSAPSCNNIQGHLQRPTDVHMHNI